MDPLHLIARAARESLDLLYAALDQAPGYGRFHQFERVAGLYRQLGVAEFLLGGDPQDLHEFLRLGVQASEESLQKAALAGAAASRMLAFFDAASLEDSEAMASIAARAPRECNRRREYEEDFLYMRIAMDTVGLGLPASETAPLLARLAELAGGTPRHRLLVAFLDRRTEALASALSELCREHEAFYAPLMPSFRVEERAILGRHVPLEVVAWFKLAQRAGMAGLRLPEMPEDLLAGCTVPRPAPGAWLEYSHPGHPRASSAEPVDLGPWCWPCSYCSTYPDPAPLEPETWSYLCVHGWTDPDYAVVDDLPDELIDFRRPLAKGKSVAERWPAGAAIALDPYRGGPWLPDIVGNTQGELICSARVRAVIEALCGDRCEYLPLTILDHKGRRASDGYVLVHPLGQYSCPWLEAGDDDEGDEDERAAWAAGLPGLCRIKQLSDRCLVSPELSQALRGIPGVTNLALERTRLP